MLLISGWGSKITQELLPLLPEGEWRARFDLDVMPLVALDATRFLFCAGILRPKSIIEQTEVEIAASFLTNCGFVIRACEAILAVNEKARICVVGSESAYLGSFDGTYAAAKAGLHHYVESVSLKPGQQLVCVSPGIIEDAGMTMRREDRGALARRRDMHPKRRFLKAIEVARMIHFLLYVDEGYTSGTVIRMNGGGR